MNSFLF